MALKPITLDDLRRYAIARSLFTPCGLQEAIRRLGFVQADPIRAPARAQDLTLRHRVRGYRAGDLERRYGQLDVEEDFFVNYGFLPRATQALMHPRTARTAWSAARWAQAREVLAFVQQRGVVHPRDVDAHFQHGKARNWFGGSTNASTQLLDGMHYRGLLRVAGRQSGVRTYAPSAAYQREGPLPEPESALDQLVDVIVRKYAPLPQRSLSELISFLRGATPQWTALRSAALARARSRLPSRDVEGVRWYWPEGENPGSARYRVQEAVRLLAPFDPVVWDRRRFEHFWGWAYRFEAYTPASRRVRGYYALPLLWRDRVIGWGNLQTVDGRLVADLGYQTGQAPRDTAFRASLRQELASMERFLGLCP